MSKFVTSIGLFLAGLPLLSTKAHSTVTASQEALDILNEPTAVPLRPLNREMDNLFAGHRSQSSHRSHSSHSSHYSGSGGSASSSRAPAPAPQSFAPAVDPPATASKATPAQAGASMPAAQRPLAGLGESKSGSAGTQMTQAEKLRLQIMRVQIRLTSLGLYEGRIDGTRNSETVLALKRFQIVKGLPDTGLMSTPTLNALGVPAAN
jgi:His-Xaa-Ser repeat protein HxsA